MGSPSTLRGVSRVAAFAVLAMAALGQMAVSVSAASPSFFVDGKHGSDSNAGTSLGSAFKTVKAGLWALRYGGTLDVVGYDDYVYYEQMTGSQWFINGTPTTPVVIRAYGYGSPGAVRPIVSGAKVVSRPGDGKWVRPDAVHAPDVWVTSWTTAIPGQFAACASRQAAPRKKLAASTKKRRNLWTPITALLSTCIHSTESHGASARSGQQDADSAASLLIYFADAAGAV